MPTQGDRAPGAEEMLPKSNEREGIPGWLKGLVPPSAQGLILETRDRVPRWGPCMEPDSPLPVSLPLSLSLMNK